MDLTGSFHPVYDQYSDPALYLAVTRGLTDNNWY